MAIPRTCIGRLEHRLSDVAAAYLGLAQEDEKVGQLLISQGQYRHAMYFLIQAMEKYVRCTIFGLVNPNTEYFRNRTRTHDLDELLDFLVEIACPNTTVQGQVREQLRDFVLGGVRFGSCTTTCATRLSPSATSPTRSSVSAARMPTSPWSASRR